MFWDADQGSDYGVIVQKELRLIREKKSSLSLVNLVKLSTINITFLQKKKVSLLSIEGPRNSETDYTAMVGTLAKKKCGSQSPYKPAHHTSFASVLRGWDLFFTCEGGATP